MMGHLVPEFHMQQQMVSSFLYVERSQKEYNYLFQHHYNCYCFCFCHMLLLQLLLCAVQKLETELALYDVLNKAHWCLEEIYNREILEGRIEFFIEF